MLLQEETIWCVYNNVLWLVVKILSLRTLFPTFVVTLESLNYLFCSQSLSILFIEMYQLAQWICIPQNYQLVNLNQFVMFRAIKLLLVHKTKNNNIHDSKRSKEKAKQNNFLLLHLTKDQKCTPQQFPSSQTKTQKAYPNKCLFSFSIFLFLIPLKTILKKKKNK